MPRWLLTVMALVAASLAPGVVAAQPAEAQVCQRSTRIDGSTGEYRARLHVSDRTGCPGGTGSGGSTSASSPSSSTSSSGSGGPVCVWVPAAEVGDFLPRNAPSGPRPEGATIANLLVQQCDGELTYNVQWPSPGGAAAPGAAAQPVVVSPVDVARRVLAELAFPKPVPVIDVGIATQLETHLSVADEPDTASGDPVPGVTAELTLIPVDQSWDIRGVPGGAPPVECDSAQPPEQQCTWTPNHSSATADPAVAGEQDGVPCFPATVTVTWEVTWVVTVDGQVFEGTLEPQRRENDEECLVVGEIQALNG